MNKYSIPGLFILLVSLGYYLFTNQASSRLTQFQKWKHEFQVSYDSELEDDFRERIFHENLKMISQHNQNPSRTYDMGVNQFTAMTNEQFAAKYLVSVVPNTQIIQVKDDLKINQVPNVEVDWVQKGAVTPVKNQGQCGACWAFSCTGGLQGLSKIAYGTLKSFSEQQLIDCSATYGNRGCTGGFPSNAYKYVKEHGICSEQDYPYKATVQACKNCSNPFRISGVGETRSCSDLTNAISNQPISVTIDASNWATYRSGVLSTCGTSINHAALLVGVVGGAWKVKNQWGTSWGENGYIRLASGNTCGICISSAYPIK